MHDGERRGHVPGHVRRGTPTVGAWEGRRSPICYPIPLRVVYGRGIHPSHPYPVRGTQALALALALSPSPALVDSVTFLMIPADSEQFITGTIYSGFSKSTGAFWPKS